MDSDNIIYIGTKDTMQYVMSVTMQTKTNTEIRLKARGKAISKAVDVSQIAKDKYLTNWDISEIIIGTEIRPFRETENTTERDKINRPTQRVSFIDIKMIKKGD